MKEREIMGTSGTCAERLNMERTFPHTLRFMQMCKTHRKTSITTSFQAHRYYSIPKSTNIVPNIKNSIAVRIFMIPDRFFMKRINLSEVAPQ